VRPAAGNDDPNAGLSCVLDGGGGVMGLISTLESGEGFGKCYLPMGTKELLVQLTAGVPCEIPRKWLGKALDLCNTYCSFADIKVEADEKIAQLTPVRLELNERGRALIASSMGY
jgi:hypothetical protein